MRIDVKGAYIVDESSAESQQHQSENDSWRKDKTRRNVATGAEGRIDGEGEEEVEEAQDEDVQRDSRDIRLPHQRSFVSHMAIDVSLSCVGGNGQ